MTKVINGKKIADKTHAASKTRLLALKEKGLTPKLVVILVGEDKPSATYVKKKAQAAEKIGLDFELVKLPEYINKEDIISKIDEIQRDKNLSGLIVQLPLPEPLYTPEVLNTVKPEFDVDCLTDQNIKKLESGNLSLLPPTPGAVISILEDLKIDLNNKKVAIFGRGALVGKPLATIMRNLGAAVTVIHSKTEGVVEKSISSDVVVSAVGKKNLIRGDMVKEGAIVIDTGVDFDENGKMCGDVNMKEVSQKAAYLTPTPGGVGPITVARLLFNTVLLAEKKW
jgi:methylenetetrahydrofolate dehydrogenase (NADP+) / methenyltetrahydrofolate cyclohydrolase